MEYRKGTGLLDIYMDSMRVIVPDGCPEAVIKAAKNFSVPYSNGAFPEIFVNYPVYEESAVPDRIFSHNLILLETAKHPNKYIRRFADKMPVQCDETGYTYNSVRCEGNYVAMQVIANPYDPRRSFLVISANDEALLRKHILLRKVIIPTYINGLHPLWNNEVLIFDGRQYLAAYEIGVELFQVNNMSGGGRA